MVASSHLKTDRQKNSFKSNMMDVAHFVSVYYMEDARLGLDMTGVNGSWQRVRASDPTSPSPQPAGAWSYTCRRKSAANNTTTTAPSRCSHRHRHSPSLPLLSIAAMWDDEDNNPYGSFARHDSSTNDPPGLASPTARKLPSSPIP